jgi:hypothetical protein
MGDGTIVNVAMQDVCPTNTADHLALGSYDPVGYALAVRRAGQPRSRRVRARRADRLPAGRAAGRVHGATRHDLLIAYWSFTTASTTPTSARSGRSDDAHLSTASASSSTSFEHSVTLGPAS